MIKINQTRFGEGIGNCFTACVCCILEISDVEATPVFCHVPGDWYKYFCDWLLKNYNLHSYYLPIKSQHSEQILNGIWPFDIKLPAIISGPNHDNIGHAVVYCEDNSIWNTNPNCKGLILIEDIIYFAHSCITLGTIDDLEL